MNNMICQNCRVEFEDRDRIIFSRPDTFVFKPADVKDTVNPALASPAELLESRKQFTKTTVVNVYANFGLVTIPENAFNLRHLRCEPVHTGAAHGTSPRTRSGPWKHAVRFTRAMKRGKVSGGQS